MKGFWTGDQGCFCFRSEGFWDVPDFDCAVLAAGYHEAFFQPGRNKNVTGKEAKRCVFPVTERKAFSSLQGSTRSPPLCWDAKRDFIVFFKLSFSSLRSLGQIPEMQTPASSPCPQTRVCCSSGTGRLGWGAAGSGRRADEQTCCTFADTFPSLPSPPLHSSSNWQLIQPLHLKMNRSLTEKCKLDILWTDRCTPKKPTTPPSNSEPQDKQGPGTRSSMAWRQAATSGPAKQPPPLLAKRTPRPIFITLSTRQRLLHGHGPVPGPHRSPFRPCSSARREGFCPAGGEDRICCAFLPALSSSCTQHICEPAYPLSSSSKLCLPVSQLQAASPACRFVSGGTGTVGTFFPTRFLGAGPHQSQAKTSLNPNARCSENETSPFRLIKYKGSHFPRDSGRTWCLEGGSRQRFCLNKSPFWVTRKGYDNSAHKDLWK